MPLVRTLSGIGMSGTNPWDTMPQSCQEQVPGMPYGCQGQVLSMSQSYQVQVHGMPQECRGRDPRTQLTKRCSENVVVTKNYCSRNVTESVIMLVSGGFFTF